MLADLVHEQRTLIFYEAPHRVFDALSDMKAVFGERMSAVSKEITKIHEEILRGGISEILDRMKGKETAGEYVIVVEGRTERNRPAPADVLSEVRMLMKKGLGRKEAVKKVAGEYHISKKELYDRSLATSDETS
jgi:16S rRNA (cytidine1402-2'-O)-methyltransferase